MIYQNNSGAEKMHIGDSCCKTEKTKTDKEWLHLLLEQDKYRLILIICVMAGILAGSFTQACYGNTLQWTHAIETYCSGFLPAFLTIAPITVGIIAVIFLCAVMSFSRWLIYPATVFRGLGIGSLFCGALQCGRIKELCFATIVLLPYLVVSCLLTVLAGEYALGLRHSFTRENEGMKGSLVTHAMKMFTLYMGAAVISCLLFGGSCTLFGKYLI